MSKLDKKTGARFVGNESGNISIMFGLLVIPLFGLAGAAVDYSKAFRVKSQMQTVADAAALAGTTYYKRTGDEDGANVRIRNYVTAGLLNYGLTLEVEGQPGDPSQTRTVTLRNENINVSDSTSNPTLETTIDTTVLGILGIDTLDVEASAKSQVTDETVQGTKQLDLALMFDATGSMLETTSTGNSKLYDAKQAAKDLMDIVMPADRDYNTRISLVPFAQNTKVSADVVTAITQSPATIATPHVTTVTVTYASSDYEWTSQSTCKTRYKQYYMDQGQSSTDASTSANNYCKTSSSITWRKVGKKTEYSAPTLATREEERTTYTYTYIKPCMNERMGDDQWSDENPVTSGGWTASYSSTQTANVNCPIANTVVPLTDDRDALSTAIDNITTSSWTAGQMGTAWAWYTISPEWADIWPADSTPLEYGAENTIKAAVLMTDGEYNKVNCTQNNTTCPSSPTQALNLCTEMKEKGIIVFTVGFGVGSNATAVSTLTQCASPGKHYFPYDGDSMRAAFRDIGAALVNIQAIASDGADSILVQ